MEAECIAGPGKRNDGSKNKGLGHGLTKKHSDSEVVPDFDQMRELLREEAELGCG